MVKDRNVEAQAGLAVKPVLGISACLLGQCVRYDGQHKQDSFLTDVLGKIVQYIPVCPETECGLGIPRPPLRLAGSSEAPALFQEKTGRDLTGLMNQWADCRLEALAKEDLCGFVFKAKSPSCGIQRVKLYNSNGALVGSTRGMFASRFMQRFPLLPVEDEGRLQDSALRQNFVERVFAFRRFKDAVSEGPQGIVNFHASHKLLLMSHSHAQMQELGRLVASAGGKNWPEIRTKYEELLMKTLALKATPAKHSNVLMHVLGFFKKHISGEEKKNMLDIISAYKAGDLPLLAPIVLLKHFALKFGVAWLNQQVYLDLKRVELKLATSAI